MDNIPIMTWLPPMVMTIIIILGMLIGYWNGWKTATYFFSWNIIALATSILVLHFKYDKLVNFTSNEIINNVVENNKGMIKPVLSLIVSLVIILSANFLAFLVYFIVFPIRRALKKSIKNNKKNGHKNRSARLVGLSIGTTTALPIAAFATSLSYFSMNKVDSFGKISSQLTRGLSFGQFKNTNESIIDLKEEVMTLYNLVKDEKLQSILKTIVGKGDIDAVPISLEKAQIDNLVKALKGNILLPIMSDSNFVEKIIDGFKEEDYKNIDLTPPHQNLVDLSQAIPVEDRDDIREKLKKFFEDKRVPDSETKATDFVNKLFNWT